MSKQITLEQIEEAYNRQVIIYKIAGNNAHYAYLESNLKNLVKRHFESIYLPFTIKGQYTFINRITNKSTKL
jgi:hypothetical protein